MFVRKKVVTRHTYDQVVRAVRDGSQVRQVIVAALGTSPTVEAAIRAERRRHAHGRRERASWPEGFSEGATRLTARPARRDGPIEEATQHSELRKGLLKTRRADAKQRARRAHAKTAGVREP